MRILVALIALLAVAPSAARAHTALDHASPPAGGAVAAAPHEVALYFSENLEAAFSAIEVTDADGSRVDAGKAQVSGNTMRVGLKPLQPGSYHVHWRTLSVDTHKTQGSFSFRVGGH